MQGTLAIAMMFFLVSGSASGVAPLSLFGNRMQEGRGVAVSATSCPPVKLYDQDVLRKDWPGRRIGKSVK